MYYPREIDAQLLVWRAEGTRKPLVLRGARQTGKSQAVRQLGKSFELYLELNLEREADARLVRGCESPAQLLESLRLARGLEELPRETLLFLDEVQRVPQVLQWLRFFYEDHPGLAVIAAGSHLARILEESDVSIPVGRVTYRTLRPFGFGEFLGATGDDAMASRLAKPPFDERGASSIHDALHEQCLARLREYLLVGGMPACVAEWAATRDLVRVRRLQTDLSQSLLDDLQRYDARDRSGHLSAAYEHLRQHWGRRYAYENFAPGRSSREMKVALEKLEASTIVTRVLPTSSIQVPLVAKPKFAPKLLQLDIGLALHEIGLSPDSVSREPVEKLLDGRVAEMTVGQALLRRLGTGERLHFWTRDDARAHAELDYLWMGPKGPVPVEVKSGKSGTLRSLHQYLLRAGTGLGVRFWAGPPSDERHSVALPTGQVEYRLLSLPLYLAERLPIILQEIS